MIDSLLEVLGFCTGLLIGCCIIDAYQDELEGLADRVFNWIESKRGR